MSLAPGTRLERSVALKVLPRELSADTELRARLTREARAISALAHPHNCALYDVGSEDGLDYLVMELLDGETLADRLAKGSLRSLPTELVLRFGAQIADALDRAHRQGIVHRDLKPGSVMLTRSGVKLLDFGLAKVREAAGGDPVLPRRSGTSRPRVSVSWSRLPRRRPCGRRSASWSIGPRS